VNIVRILVAVLTIVLLFAATAAGIDSHDAAFAVLPFVCFHFALASSFEFAPDPGASPELATVRSLRPTRAPPVF
jgi:hypothetical protein